MKDLLKLFSLLQLTKEQSLTGYLVAGIKSHEIPSLADHHYTAALMGWCIVGKIKQAGGKINERKVVLMLLMHDLSELFGGDIAAPLNRKYPDLRQYKNKIGERAIGLLSEYMDDKTGGQLKDLWQEMEEGTSDETVVVKIMDQMDHQMFLEHYSYKNKYSPGKKDYRPVFVENHIYKLTERLRDPKTKAVMDDFLKEFNDNFFNEGYQGMQIMMEEREA